MITKVTRRQSYQEIKKTMSTRRQIILDALRKRPRSTARELAQYLFEQKVIPSPERNFVHPRLTELLEDGIVKAVDKKKDPMTGKMVAVYELNDHPETTVQGTLNLEEGVIEWPTDE